MGRGAADKKDGNMANDTANDTAAAKKAPVTQFQFAQKPEELPGWEGFKRFMWNGETKQFMGRTGCSWLKIGVFYVIYYAFLSAYFVAMMLIFYQTLDDNEPKWKGPEKGIIGMNPGLGYRPHPPDSNIESTLIHYRKGDYNGNWQPWVKRLNDFLEDYHNLKEDSNKKPNKNADIVDCDFNKGPGPEQICKVNVEGLFQGMCTNETQYGWKAGTPCIAIKLNKIFDWKPEPFKKWTELPNGTCGEGELPPCESAPKDLIDFVKEKQEMPGSPMVGNMVWLSCEGENPADRENLGPVKYYPQPGIPKYYFPYKNQPGYLSPLVFAHLEKPKQGVLIAVSCKAWAQNLVHDVMERVGTVHFELMID